MRVDLKERPHKVSIKTLFSVRKHLPKVVCFILFIYSGAFNNNVISNGKSYCCSDSSTDVQFTSLLAKIFNKNTNYFYAIYNTAD